MLAQETNIVSSGAGDTHWALTDHEGSVRDVIDNSGSPPETAMPPADMETIAASALERLALHHSGFCSVPA